MVLPVVFIRDDDVFEVDSRFHEVFEFAKKYRVPIIYGVIPARIEEKLARILKRAKERLPGLLDIVQHGFAHDNHAACEGKKYEFGANRTYCQQYHDIRKGAQIMRSYFGRCWTPGFIPPYHGYDRSTLKAIHELKIPLFSAGRKVSCPKKKFLDLPACISLNDYGRDSTPLAFDLRKMLDRTLRAVAPNKVTGAVFHHRAVRTRADMRAIKAFLRHMAQLRDEGKIRIVLFSELIRFKCPGEKVRWHIF